MSNKKGVQKKINNNIETIKTILIVLLMLFCAYFTFLIIQFQQIGNSDKFSLLVWENFNNTTNPLNNIDTDTINKTFSNYSSPLYIVVNRNDARDVFHAGSVEYKTALDASNDIINLLYIGDSITKQDILNSNEEWFGALNSDSFYLKYPYAIQPKISMQFMGLSDTPITKNINSFNEVIISPGPSQGDSISVYIKDIQSNKMVKVSTNISSDNLSRVIEKFDSIVSKTCAFAFELNLDNTSGLKSLASINLNPTLLIPLNTVNTPTVTSSTPTIFKNSLYISSLSPSEQNTLSIFGYNPNIIRQYIDKDDVIVFVDDYSTLKLYPQGIIEYKSIDDENGLSLYSNGDIDSKYNSLLSLINLISKLSDIYGIDYNSLNSQIKITDIINSEKKSDLTTIHLDYTIEGNMIKDEQDISDLYDGHFISATLNKGKLTSFRFNIKNFSKAINQPNEPLFSAIDRYFESNNSGEIVSINKSYLYYTFNSEGSTMHTSWYVEK